MNSIFTIVCAAIAGGLVVAALFSAAVWHARKRGLVLLPKEAHRLERRLLKLEAAQIQFERQFNQQAQSSQRKSEADKRAERGIMNILRGLTRTAVQQEERLNTLNKNQT